MAGFPKIPGCKVLSELGEGGMATVYLGIQENLNRKVAIKVLDPKLLKNEITAKRFKMEAEAAAKLSHSNIVQIIDVGKFRNHYYIIMEYLVDSLKDRMKTSPGGKMEPQTALEIVQAIMAALEFAHSRNISHRDIKPDNIMFREDNTPVLVDFGVARILDASETGGLTKSGQSMGTVYYMSPEQCSAQKDVDGRSDIYSLGAVLYEMLTGKRPYEADNMVSVALKHVQEKVPKLPKDLKSYQPLIDKMMAKNREKRISSEAQFRKILDKIITAAVNPTHQPKYLKSAPTSKIPKNLILKKSGGALKQYMEKVLNFIKNLKKKPEPFIKGKLIPFVREKSKKTFSFIKEKLIPFMKKVGKKPFSMINKHLGPFIKEKLKSFKKYPVKKKMVWGILPVVLVALVVVIFIIIFSPGSKSIKNKEVSVSFTSIYITSIYKLFAEDLPYHMGLNIVREN
jgi:serine/threonine protein kinase